MKDLHFILKRMPQVLLAEMLGICKANVTLWKSKKSVPKKHYLKLKEIKNELTRKSK